MPLGIGKKLDNKCFAPRNTTCERALSHCCAVVGNLDCCIDVIGKNSFEAFAIGATAAVRNSVDCVVGNSAEWTTEAVSEAKT